MNVGEWIAGIGAAGSVLGGGGVFMARATVKASRATAAAQEAAAKLTAEPNQRAADLEAFREIRDDMAKQLHDTRTEVRSLRSLVRAFAGYVGDLTTQMRGHGIEPPAPPERVERYNRTGV